MIYLDYHATTPCDPRVVEAMLPFFGITFGNASSTLHSTGREALTAVDKARAQVAALIGARPGEIVFTSGATESNNLALLGLARGMARVAEMKGNPVRRRIVTSPTEHKAVLEPCHQLEKEGFELVQLPVDRAGLVSVDGAERAITDDTLLVSIQMANNEIGTIQPLTELAGLAHNKGALVHTDAAQAVGKIGIDVGVCDIDLLSLSAHKVYGPKGVGALYIRGGISSLPIQPLVFGGGQERDLRPGTLNVPGIVGLGAACRLCMDVLPSEATHVGKLRDKLESVLMYRIPGVQRNGFLGARLPGNSSLTFPGIEAEALIANIPEIALSTGSACTSGAPEPSYVLTAIGLSREAAYSTLRIGLGRFTTEEEVSYASTAIVQAAERLRTIEAAVL